MKKLVIVVLVLMLSVSMVYAATMQNFLLPGKTNEERAAYLEQRNESAKAQVAQINKDKKACADNKVKALENQIAWFKSQIERATQSKDTVTKNPTAYADAQVKNLEAQVKENEEYIKQFKAINP